MSEDPDYEALPLATLEHLAEQGDAGAQEALDTFSVDMSNILRPFVNARGMPPLEQLLPATVNVRPAVMEDDDFREMVEAQQVARAAAVAREEAMVANLAAMRAAVERSEAREAAALERADAAETREAERKRLTERREWTMAAMTAIAMIAAVVAIFTS